VTRQRESGLGQNGRMAEYEHTREFRGARFFEADVSDARFHSCDLRRVKITDSFVTDLNISGVFERLIVNEVDVTAYVRSELDRRHPELAQVRDLETPEDYRAMWDTLERLWAETGAWVERLPEQARYEQVDGEWSYTETLRHLVFATDKWAAGPILDQESPWHPLGLPHAAVQPDEAARFGLTPAAKPSYAEVMAARADRVALVRRIVEGLTEDELARTCARAPDAEAPDDRHTVAQCLSVIMGEEAEHRRYATRDLAVLAARQA
jgi:DinB superfamily